jgi:hypothetical protein
MISTVFEATKKALNDVLVSLGQPLPSHELGLDNLQQNESFPRIVWELLGGEVRASRQLGADKQLAVSASGKSRVREIAGRNEKIAIHVWEADFTAVEVLMNHFVAALRYGATAFSFRPLSTNWGPGQSAISASGRVCVLVIEIDIPFTTEPMLASPGPHNPVIAPAIPAAS